MLGTHSGYIGVYRHSEVITHPRLKKPWFARVVAEGKIYHLGSFADAEQAAIARDAKAKQVLWNPRLNFPKEH